MANHEDYEVNFFRPLSKHAKENKKLILSLAITWAIAVFGFHFLLIIITTPTPEKTLDEFNSVWPQVLEESSTKEMKQIFSRTCLMVLGKNIALKDDHKNVLKESLSWSVYSLQADSAKSILEGELDAQAINAAALSINLDSKGFDKIMKDLLKTSLVNVESPKLSSASQKSLPDIMNLYLTHNQSILTDFKFLGFPFHYWYTAQFLLILFVGLCLIYALVIEKMNTKHEFVEET